VLSPDGVSVLQASCVHVIEMPEFASLDDFRLRLGDVTYWEPYVAATLLRHGLSDGRSDPTAGYNPTWPTFVFDDVVVKLFGYHQTWQRTFDAERTALARASTDPEILVPTVLGEGALFDSNDAWAYLIIRRIPGAASWPDESAADQWPSIARELGRQVKRIHGLRREGISSDTDWADIDITAAAARSSLPSHLAAQAQDYVDQLGPFDRVFVHGDIVAQHVFLLDGHLSGIIDWADALVTDRHYELIQIFRDTLDCDRDLFRVFLEASDWPVTPDFPQRTMGHALRRQAFMLAQHPSGDCFEPIAENYPLEDIATLDELARLLFDV
jgi:hygromycin-B 7''-O-kinase